MQQSNLLEMVLDIPKTPQQFPDYSSQEYWNKRYKELFKNLKNDADFSKEDWYLAFTDISKYLDQIWDQRDEELD